MSYPIIPEIPKALTIVELSTLLANCTTVEKLRSLVKENKNRLNALHDSVICIACGRLGAEADSDYFSNNRSECIKVYLISLRNWLSRRFGSPGRDPQGCANIIHAGAKLCIDPSNALYRDLCKVAITMSHEFGAQEVSNCLWSMATLGISTSNELSELVPSLILQCIEHVTEFNMHDVSNCLLAVAKLGTDVTGEALLPLLFSCCMEKAKDLNEQQVTNCLWSIATLRISNKPLIHVLFQVCIKRAKELIPQGVSACIWAVATLGEDYDNDAVVAALLICLDNRRTFSDVDVAVIFWSLATLRVSDSDAIQDITRVCTLNVHLFSPKHAVMCLWAMACLSRYIDDTTAVRLIINTCFELSPKFCDYDISLSLWSLASLSEHYSSYKEYLELSSALVRAIETRYLFITRVDEANQCLQAHHFGLKLSDEVVNHLYSIIHKGSALKSTSSKSTMSQESVALTLRRLGYSPRLEVPIYNGLVSVDIVIELSDESSSSIGNGGASAMSDSPTLKLAIEFDGPTHFMRKAKGSTACVGPIDTRTRLRNSLIKRSGIFKDLLVIPYYEWDEASESLWKRGVSGIKTMNDGGNERSTVETRQVAYIEGKIRNVLRERQGAGFSNKRPRSFLTPPSGPERLHGKSATYISTTPSSEKTVSGRFQEEKNSQSLEKLCEPKKALRRIY